MKKVIVRLGNGLGNQLFTYASAYVFAKKNDAELYVDDESGFYKRHKYELHNFNISAKIIEKKYKFTNIFGRIKRKILIKFPRFNPEIKFLIEKKSKDKLTYFNPEQFNINFDKILYIEGYFQSEKYFKNQIDDILKEFSFKDEIKKQNITNIDAIKNSNSVSIHFRQDKFLKDEKHKNLHKLNKEFLTDNIKLIKKGIDYFDNKLDKPKYFVWSNNFDEIKDLFTSSKFFLMKENTQKDPAYDLYLMSLCKHFILSPSTLHYWGAFLSKNNNKICLSPPDILNKSGYYGFSNNRDIKTGWWKDI